MAVDRQRYRVWINIIATLSTLIVAVLPILVSQHIHRSMVHEEKTKMKLWAAATEALGGENEDAPINVMLQIVSSNTTIPVILVNDNDSIVAFNNISIKPTLDTVRYLQQLRKSFGNHYAPLPIDLGGGNKQLLYYDDSSTLRELYIFPLIQLPIFLFFLIVVALAWHLANKNGQNQLWIGLSKETAHQLGTPISSLIAWIELLRETDSDSTMLDEMRKDVARLETISHRFQRFGADPTLSMHDIVPLINGTLQYLERRISKGVTVFTNIPRGPIYIKTNEDLFSWVIENLVKNAVDAMDGKGQITLTVQVRNKSVYIDISDTGKGVSRQNRHKIFRPGFSTKKKGWGLGLSLARRIVNNYHKGKLILLRSEPMLGTTFRIKLPLCSGMRI